MSKLTIEYWPLERLKRYERQLKKREGSVEKMMQSIKEYGFKVPVLATAAGEIIDGESRVMAGERLGYEEVPVIPADDLTPAQVRAFRIMVNRSSTWAEWDEQLLALELKDLQEVKVDLRLTGLALPEVERLLRLIPPTEGLVDEDEVPETPAEPVARPGDMWELGRHLVLCGDSTNPEDVVRLMGGGQADMVWTDPPYNVDYEGRAGKILNDKMSGSAFYRFLHDAFSAAYPAVVDGGAIYVAHADTEGLSFRRAFANAGFKLASCLVWRKNMMVIGRSDYQWQHEPILYGWKPTGPHRWYGARNKTTVIDWQGGRVRQLAKDRFQVALQETVLVISGRGVQVEELPGTVICEKKPVLSKEHPTTKPVALIERMIRNSSVNGDTVLDLFGGSGSTLITAEKTGRVARIMELDPRFVDVEVRRWEAFTGMRAELIERREG